LGWLQRNEKQHRLNPFVVGIKNALSQSSLPILAAASSVSSFRQRQQECDHEEHDILYYEATRSASVRPAEASTLAVTTKPHLKQRKVSLFGRRQQHRKSKQNEEAFWLDGLDDLDEELGEEDEKMIPCSITQPAALQGKFQVLQNPRSPPTSSKAAATAIDTSASASSSTRGGTSASMAAPHRPLFFWENMVSGAISRSIAQTIMHPANTMKTVLQNTNDVSLRDLCQPRQFRRLTVGANANFILSIPHGAVNFAVLEFVRGRMNAAMEAIPALNKRKDALGPALDFLSSCVSTVTCSIVSTPQMMITDVSQHD
jgi:hypothetical protein